jgi:hypothetical protein
MKVIFLDVDGVLNSRNSFERDRPQTAHYLAPECVEQLARICQSVHDVKVVLSSTWRMFMPVLMLQDILRQRGVPITIIDATPPDVGVGHDGRRLELRGNEIQAWLDKHEHRVKKFVILDDDSDMAHLAPHLVQTRFEYGLTDVEANEVIWRLGDTGLQDP